MGMEYVYAALALHEAGKEITEDNIEKMFQGLDLEVDKVAIKQLVKALEGVNLEEILKAPLPTVTAPPVAATEAKEEKKEEKKEEEKKEEEEAMKGLSALFG